MATQDIQEKEIQATDTHDPRYESKERGNKMKKLILIISVMLIALSLSACNDNTDRVVKLASGEMEHATYYTQEEVDELLEEITNNFDYQALNNLNERVLELESELRDFERFEYEDLLDLLDYMESEDGFATEFDNYLIEHYQSQIDELLQRIAELESETE